MHNFPVGFQPLPSANPPNFTQTVSDKFSPMKYDHYNNSDKYGYPQSNIGYKNRSNMYDTSYSSINKNMMGPSSQYSSNLNRSNVGMNYNSHKFDDNFDFKPLSVPTKAPTTKQLHKVQNYENKLDEFLGSSKKDYSNKNSNFDNNKSSYKYQNTELARHNDSFGSSNKYKLDFKPMNTTKTLKTNQTNQKQSPSKQKPNYQFKLSHKQSPPKKYQQNKQGHSKITNYQYQPQKFVYKQNSTNLKIETQPTNNIITNESNSLKTPTFSNNNIMKLNLSPEKNRQSKSKSQFIEQNMTIAKQTTPVRSQYASKSRQPTPRKNDDEVSYTKFLLLQMKNQQLQKQLTQLKRTAQLKQQQYSDSEKSYKMRIDSYQKNLQQQKQNHLDQIATKNQYIQQQAKQYENQLQKLKEQNLQNLYHKQKQYQRKQQEIKGTYLKIIEEKDSQIMTLFKKVTKADEEYRDAIRKSQLEHLVNQIQKKHQIEAMHLTKIQSLQKQLQMNQQELTNLKQHKDKTLAYTHQLSENLQKTVLLLNRTKADNPSLEQTINTQYNEAKILNHKIEQLYEEATMLRQKLQQQIRSAQLLHNEYKTILVKQKTSKNKQTTELSMIITKKNNQINSLTKKIKTLQNRYQLAIGDNKNKDQFIYKYILNKKDKLNDDQTAKSVEQALKYSKSWLEFKDQCESCKQENQQLRKKIQLCGI